MEQKFSNNPSGYSLSEAEAIHQELKQVQHSLYEGEREKAELIHSLARLKDDLTRIQAQDSSPDVSTLSLVQEKLSTASQTDLSGEVNMLFFFKYCVNSAKVLPKTDLLGHAQPCT